MFTLSKIIIKAPGTRKPTIYKWLFQLDDSQSLHRKWLEITKHLFNYGCLGFQAVEAKKTHFEIHETEIRAISWQYFP